MEEGGDSTIVYECDEVQLRHKGTVTKTEVNNNFEYWWTIGEGLNGFSASTGDEAKEPEISEPEGSTLDLLYRTMKDEFGGGDARKAALGSRYNEVQDVINHIDKASVQELVDEVWAGKYGDDEVRRTVLGSRWQEVQDVINAGNKKYYTIKSGDTLSGIAAKYETTVNAIAQLNGIENPNLIIAGDTIRVK